MTKKTKTILASVGGGILVLALVAVIWGPTLYRTLFVGEAAERAVDQLQSSAASASASAVAVDDLAGGWTVASGSYAGYRVDEVLQGEDVTVTARTQEVSGTATVTDGQLTAADLTVQVSSIASDSSQRDRYFTGTAVKASTYPEATFTLTSPVALTADGALSSTVEATGDLTIAGVTKSVTFEITVQAQSDQVAVAGSIPITFADFGVTAPSLGFVSVEDHGEVEFLLNLAQA